VYFWNSYPQRRV